MNQVAVSGNIFSYGQFGDFENSPILILHGWGRSGQEWTQLGKELSAWNNRKVYILDLPGFGGSSLPNVSNIHDYSELVSEFCKYLDIKKVILIGHSLGGRIGIVMGANKDSILTKLILINPAGVKPVSIKRLVLRIFAKIFFWIPREIRNLILGRIMDEDFRNSPALQKLYRAVVGEDLRKYLPKIKCETVVIWGEWDRVLPISLLRVYRKYLKNRIVRVVWGAGHDPHLTQADQILRILQEYTE